MSVGRFRSDGGTTGYILSRRPPVKIWTASLHSEGPNQLRLIYNLLRLENGQNWTPGVRKTRQSGTQMVEFLKRPQMEKLAAPARSLDRDGKD